MSIQNKPDYKVFASDAKSGEIETFPDILRGWGVTIEKTGEIPPMEWFNAIGKRVDEWLLYLTQRGIPEWDSSLDYPKSAIVMHGDNFYVSKKTSKGESPSTTQATWATLSAFLGLGDYATNTALSDGLAGKLDKTGGGLRGNNGVLYLSSTAANQPLFMSFFNSSSKLLGYVGRPDDKEDIALVNSLSGAIMRITSGNKLTFNGFDVITSNSVAQSVGTSTTSVMSQKAVADIVIGVGQTWRDVLSSRKPETMYTNTTGKPIVVAVSGYIKAGEPYGILLVDSIQVGSIGTGTSTATAIVPAGSTYKLSNSILNMGWAELR